MDKFNKQTVSKIADRLLNEIKRLDRKTMDESVGETSRRQKAQKSIEGTNKNVRTIAILTSENPRFKDNVDNGDERGNYGSDNAERRNDLEKHLKVGHYAWFPVKGQYGGKENSYMVYNISLDDAMYLGQKYGQESIIWIDGTKCQYWEQYGDGKYHLTHERNMGDRIDMTNADDFYTQISRAFKFQIPFFDGSDENKETLSQMNERVERVINERVPDKSKANLFLETCLIGKSGFNKYADRSKLYGMNFNGNLNEGMDKLNMPNLKHTKNAFKPGETLYLRLQKTVNGKVIRVDEPTKILKVNPDSVQIERGGKTYTIPKDFEKIRCTDTWYRVFEDINQGYDKNEGDVGTDIATFDYQNVEGEDSVVVLLKYGIKNPVLVRYNYDEVRNNLNNGTKLKAKPMRFRSEEENTFLWLKPGEIKPFKSKNQVEGAVNVRRDWIVFQKEGASFNASIFRGWNINKADEICRECPWLSKKPAVWVDDSVENRPSKKTTPDKFFVQ